MTGPLVTTDTGLVDAHGREIMRSEPRTCPVEFEPLNVQRMFARTRMQRVDDWWRRDALRGLIKTLGVVRGDPYSSTPCLDSEILDSFEAMPCRGVMVDGKPVATY